jgi:branched-chain amino acid transport system substrate-binding protein
MTQPFTRSRQVFAALLVSLLVTAGCGGGDDDQRAATQSSPDAAQQAQPAPDGSAEADAPATDAGAAAPAGDSTVGSAPAGASAASPAGTPSKAKSATASAGSAASGSSSAGAGPTGSSSAPEATSSAAPVLPSAPGGSDGAAPANGNRTGVTDDTIKIGCATARSGPVGGVGRQWKQGMEAYFKMINDQGGIHGRKIEFIGEDSGFDPARGLAGTKKLVEVDKVFALCDPDYAGEFLIAPYADKNQIPMAALGLWEGVRTSKWVFGSTPSGKNQTRVPIRWAIQERKAKSIGVIYLDNEWGKTGLEGAQEAAKAYGGEITVTRGVTPGSNDLQSVVLAMRAANPDFILQITDPVPCLKAWTAAQQQQYKPPKGWLGTTCYLEAVADFLGDWGDGFLGLAAVTGPYARATNPEVDRAMTTIKKYYPDWEPFVYSLMDWATAQIMVEALQRAGRDLTREGFRDAWEGLKGFSGGLQPPDEPVNYSPTNHAAHTASIVVEIKKKKWEPVSGWIRDELQK